MKRSAERPVRKSREERPNPGPWLLLLAVAFAARALVAWLSSGSASAAPAERPLIDGVAWGLAQGAGFSVPGPEASTPTALLPPLVPWSVSLVYRAAGHVLFPVLLLQCLLGALACLLIAWFGTATFGGTIGRSAGWIAAFDPLLLVGSATWLEESLLGPLLLVALCATAAWVKTPRPGRALGVGISWGLAVLTHELVLFLPLLALVWAWIPLGLTVTPGDRNRQAFLVVLGAVLVVGPWTIRNALVMRAAVPVTTRAGRTLLAGNNDVVWGDRAHRGEGVDVARVPSLAQKLAGRSEPDADATAGRLAWRFLTEHVGQWPMMAAAKAARLWRPVSEAIPPPDFPAAGPPLRARVGGVDVLALWSFLSFPLALWGVGRILTSARRWYQSLALLVVLYVTAAAIVFYGALSARVPIEPLIALYAAAGFEAARRRMRSRVLGLKVVEGRRS